MVRNVTVACTQMQIPTRDPEKNLVRAGRRGTQLSVCAFAVADSHPHPALCHLYAHTPLQIGSSPLQDQAEQMVRNAAAAGANVVLLQVGRYACAPIPCFWALAEWFDKKGGS